MDAILGIAVVLVVVMDAVIYLITAAHNNIHFKIANF
tara:strand:- start:115 stop:225 length:111 start_codon:yes stop_codon:yes gene_type:complete